jgi:hypothetical protein
MTCEVIDSDSDRNALYDFSEVAGSIVGRKQRKLLTACRCNAFDVAVEGHAGKHVDLYAGRLARPHVAELRLFEVCHDINVVQGNHGHELRARLNISTGARIAV